MYELETMFRALATDGKPEQKEFDAGAAADRWRKLGMSDVKV